MRFNQLRRACLFVIVAAAAGLSAGMLRGAEPAPVEDQPPASNVVYEWQLSNFEAATYDRAIEQLLQAFERQRGEKIVPGEQRRVGLKVYSDSGAGLRTPLNLLRALIAALERRGYSRDELFILGLNEARLRESEFLPPLSARSERFEGVPVEVLEDGDFYEAGWYYESALPSRSAALLAMAGAAIEEDPSAGDDRKSLLPVPLMFDVDYWFNLPICSDHPALDINGALVNATLWNASNTYRFFRSPANAPAAAAEMAAIPEMRARQVCTILSLERYQFVGGPAFNSLYTVSEPLLWLSDNPVMIDALLRERIDRARTAWGFRPLPDDVKVLRYAEQLGIGSAQISELERVRVGPRRDADS